MSQITTRQRDLIQILTNSNDNIGISTLADYLGLSPRQVQYDLVQIRPWLGKRGITLVMKPGVGVQLGISEVQKTQITTELLHSTKIQLVLTPQQRQQLILFLFLTSDEAIILNHLTYVLQVSRTTILKDLEFIEIWFQQREIRFLRKPNFGFQIDCSEKQRRESLALFLWGNSEDFESPLFQMSHLDGLWFAFQDDVEKLEILANTNSILKEFNTRRVIRRVTFAEAQLGGRFTDDAVLYLSLVFAIQAYRVNQKKYLDFPENEVKWVKERPVWVTARQISKKLITDPYFEWTDTEIAYIAMQLISVPRNERWPGDLDAGIQLNQIIDQLMEIIADRNGHPHLLNDPVLREGIVIHTIPALFRKKFQLLYPFQSNYHTERQMETLDMETAQEIITRISEQFNIQPPLEEIENIALLIRAAVIRDRSNHIGKVIVVCPSGMATAQLLIARLRAHFPRLNKLEVVSMRDVMQNQTLDANLIITTIPFSLPKHNNITILQVHPLLLPEDIEKITRFLNNLASSGL